MAARWGIDVGYVVRRRPRCSAPAARCGARCRCSARRSSCSTATRISTATTPRSSARSVASGQAGADDRVPQRRPVGSRATCSSTDGRSSATTRRHATPDDAPHRLRPRRADAARRSTACRRDGAVRSGRGVSRRSLARGRAGRLSRCRRASTRSDRPTGLEETRGICRGSASACDHELRTAAPETKRRASSSALDADAIERDGRRCSPTCAQRGGRLFFLGVGGSAANCSHAVNDFRKIAGFEAYAPTDNVSELTARTNDEGWDTVFALAAGQPAARATTRCSCFSVGGGSLEKNISPNLVRALEYAQERRRARSSASSAATAATPRRSPTPA